jgi:prepilin-type N-terminal cleavage/methylation domain-containing protein
MSPDLLKPPTIQGRNSAFTLAEVVVAVAIIAMVFGGILTAYVQATRRAEWSGYSLAAQALAMQQIEQARSGVWDPSMSPYRNDLTNLTLINRTNIGGVITGYTWNTLDVPVSGTNNSIRATNFVTVRPITPIYAGSPFVQLQLYMVRVDTVWPFAKGKTLRYFTNTLSSYFAPDNRDAQSL